MSCGIDIHMSRARVEFGTADTENQIKGMVNFMFSKPSLNISEDWIQPKYQDFMSNRHSLQES
jgi:hypothetical protein